MLLLNCYSHRSYPSRCSLAMRHSRVLSFLAVILLLVGQQVLAAKPTCPGGCGHKCGKCYNGVCAPKKNFGKGLAGKNVCRECLCTADSCILDVSILGLFVHPVIFYVLLLVHAQRSYNFETNPCRLSHLMALTVKSTRRMLHFARSVLLANVRGPTHHVKSPFDAPN